MVNILIYNTENKLIDEVSDMYNTSNAEVVEAMVSALQDLGPDKALVDILGDYL